MKWGLGGPKKYPLIVSAVVVVLFALGWWLMAGRDVPVLMPSGDIAEQQKDLILFTVVLSAIVVVPVFTLLAVFAWKYRDGAGAKHDPEHSSNLLLEAIWWGIPIAIIAVLSVVTWITSHKLDPYRPIESSNETLEVQVVALQWKWLFLYPDQGVATVNDLTIPANTPVHFSLSADAPMSAFWIPALGSQIYSMNAMTSQLNLIADREGTWTGYNTNINGDGYADMKFSVNAVDADEFELWHQNHSTTGHVLNQMHFAELSEPSVMSAPMYMRLDDSTLYDSIIAKYMTDGSHGGHAPPAKPAEDGTMEHSMHQGEGTQ